MNINKFRSNINKKGVLKNNKYEVRFGFGQGHYLNKKNLTDQEMLTLRCDNASLPGVALSSADGPPRLGYGPAERHPYSPIFEDLTLTFIVDAGSIVHKTLYEWINCIVRFDGAAGAADIATLNPGGNGLNTKASAYEVGYRDSYAASMEVHVYRDTGQRALTFKAFNAFPMGFPQVNMSWNEGDVLRLSIPFAYTDFSIEYKDFKQGPTETGRDAQAPTLTTEQQIANGLASLGGTFAPLPG